MKREFCSKIADLMQVCNGTSITAVIYYEFYGTEVVEVIWTYKDGDTNRILINVTGNSELAILEEVTKEALGFKSIGRMSRVTSPEIFTLVDNMKEVA